MAGAREDLLTHLPHLYGQPLPHLGENGTVDAHARLFHAQQDGTNGRRCRDNLACTERLHFLFEQRRKTVNSVADAGSSSSPGGGKRPAAKARDDIREGMRGGSG